MFVCGRSGTILVMVGPCYPVSKASSAGCVLYAGCCELYDAWERHPKTIVAPLRPKVVFLAALKDRLGCRFRRVGRDTYLKRSLFAVLFLEVSQI
uniref:Uncharacterized protein n=1 Tax=Ixodes scapularis TaxID=6945 RepID=A0A4D5RWN0_IXOSC